MGAQSSFVWLELIEADEPCRKNPNLPISRPAVSGFWYEHHLPRTGGLWLLGFESEAALDPALEIISADSHASPK